MTSPFPQRPFLLLATIAGLVAPLGLPVAAAAQQKPTLTPDDYGQWETLGQAVLSPDGLWLAVAISRVDDQDELRIHRTDSDSVVVVGFGRSPRFSEDGAWLAYHHRHLPRRAGGAPGAPRAGAQRHGAV